MNSGTRSRLVDRGMGMSTGGREGGAPGAKNRGRDTLARHMAGISLRGGGPRSGCPPALTHDGAMRNHCVDLLYGHPGAHHKFVYRMPLLLFS
jgi:hypothetical protein